MSDILMPGMSGYELCRNVKEASETRAIPVILLTTLNEADDIIQGLAAGADNFITKPFEPSYLLERLKSVLLGGGMRPAGARDGEFEFMGKTFSVGSSKQQILTFLISTFEDYARAKQREKEALRQDMENKRRAAESLARKAEELTAANKQLEQAHEALAEAHRRLENSFDDLQKEQALREIELRRMEVELKTARLVQMMFIPAQPPSDVPGLELAFCYRPAAETGGDWLTFEHDRDKGELGVLIGDVTGHGLASAFMTAGVYSFFATLRHLPLESPLSAETTMGLLNQVVVDLGRRERGMSLFSSRIDYTSRVIRYCNAGHPHPYVIRESDLSGDFNRDIRRGLKNLCSIGSVLGFGAGRCVQQTFQLEVGDLLLWFTDGVFENRNADGEPVTERRFLRWLLENRTLPVQALCSRLEKEIDGFLGSTPLSDDIAFILARVV
jgi:serine phosphatase RsbU (regulator of sigma subunit)